MRKVSVILICVGFFLGMNHTALASQPAIDLADYGVALWHYPSFDDELDFYVRVIDHDGVGNDHQVTVYFPGAVTSSNPNIGTINYFNLSRVPDSNLFAGWLPLASGYPPPAGNYVFRVIDPEGKEGQAIDYYSPTPINPVPDNVLSPSNRNEFMTSVFDNVYVKRNSLGNWMLYDNFDSGVFSMAKWENPTSNPIINYPAYATNGEAVLTVLNPIGRGRSRLNLKETPTTITGIKADMTLQSASSDIPKARIGGYFFKNTNTNIFSEIAIFKDRIQCSSSEDYTEDGVSRTGEFLYKVSQPGLFTGEKIQASIEWTGSQLIFEAHVENGGDYTFSFSPNGVTTLADTFKTIESVINNVTADDSPTIEWLPVTDVDRYRVRIYNVQGKSLFNFFPGTNETLFRIPPGILKPRAEYEYRIISLDNHIPGDADNFASTGYRVRFSTGPASAAPYIGFESTGVQVWNTEENGSYLTYWIRVYDNQGVPGNIKSVTVRHPNMEDTSLFYDSKSSAGSNTSTTPVTTSGIYRTDDFKRPAVSGTYTFTVEDLQGNTYSVSEDLIANPLPVPANLKINGLPAHGALLNTTAADFTWNVVPGAAFYRVELYDQSLTRTHALPALTNSLSLPVGYLKEGAVYGVRVTARREFFDENVDNGSTSHVEYMLANFRTTGTPGNSANKPTIDLFGGLNSIRKGAYVWTFPKTVNGTTVTEYWLTFEARVNDADGVPGNIKSVRVRYPGGSKELVLRYDSKVDDYTASYWNREAYTNYAEIPTGTYTFIVEDFDGNSAQITEDLAFTAPLDVPENIWPGKGDVVIEETPVIDWDEVPGAAAYRVRLYSGWSNLVHESPVLYANYYELMGYSLVGGESYSLRVYAFAEDPGTGDVDSQSSSTIFFAEKPQFTVELQQDPDGDGIYGAIDSNPSYSNAFTETGTGPTHGSIISRGGQALKIYDRAGVEGVFIETDAGVSGDPALISVCGDAADLEVNAGTHLRVICGSVKINVLKGEVKAEFYSGGEVVAASTITQESSGLILTFDPVKASFTAAPVTQSTEDDPLPAAPIVVVKEDTGVALEVAENGVSQQVRIDIKPGDPHNNFNPAGGGVLPVTIFGDANFDVTKIALDSLRLEGMELKLAGKKIYHRFEKADGDQYLDLTVQFVDTDKVMSPGEAMVALTGMMMSGDKIIGRDKLTFQP